MHPDAPFRRITTWLAILGYTLVASGLPLPFGAAATDVRDAAAVRRLSSKDRSRPFPCLDKPCGCDSADRCFTACCCLTPTETLAWARAHDVEPDVLVALERRVGGSQAGPSASGVAAPSVVTTATTKPSCCSATAPLAEQSCCGPQPAGAASAPPPALQPRGDGLSRSAAVVSAATGKPPSPAADEPSRQPRPRAVTLRAMLACGGIVAEWFAAGGALPPPRVEVSFVMLPVDEKIVADAVGAGLRAAPDAPPPRAA